MSRVVSKEQSMTHYEWGAGCDGWNLLTEAKLSIKQETMPAGAVEEWHYHQQAQQFFYILHGTATFEIENTRITVQASEGIHIKAGEKHRVCNNGTEALEFILCSQPSTIADRFNCKEP